MRRTALTLAGALLALALLLAAAPATRAGAAFPEVISIPDGWLPEGVAVGKGPVIYSGSRANGGIYAANLRTGEGEIVVPGQAGRIAVGLSFDPRSNYIYAAGGANGNAFVYDAASGAEVGAFSFTQGVPTFINDVIVTRGAAYFTNSQRAEIYRVAIGPGGSITSGEFSVIPLGGDWQQVTGFNANGIEATANGKTLIIVNSTTGTLYAVDPTTGVADAIDLGGDSVTQGDGILLEGNTLYVLRNRSNEIAVVRLAPDLASGAIVERITSPNFDVPTTLARFGSGLYAVNARFSTPPTPTTPYTIVRVER